MERSKYFFAGWVIDGSGGRIQERVLFKTVNGTISSMKSCEKSEVPAGCIDLSHCTIMPPLVDSHVHLWMSGAVDSRTREHQLIAGYDDLRPVISQHLKYHLSHGVLAVREGGHKDGVVLRCREDGIESPENVVITKIAGRAWHRKGRYGALIGRSPGDNETLASAFSRDGDRGDHVKLVNSGLNSLREFGKETLSQFSVEEISAFVDLAEKQNKKVMVHANGREPVRVALEAGCHSIEHGFFMGRENLELMVEKNVFWVPTVYTMKAYAENMGPKMPGSRKVAEKNYMHQLKQLKLARELGVRVALGTDAGSMGVLHGESVVEELKLFMKAGYSLSKAIQCATSNGAQLLEIEDMGLLQEGKEATFIVARGTPSQLPRKLSYLEGIFVNGLPSDGYRKNPIKTVRQ